MRVKQMDKLSINSLCSDKIPSKKHVLSIDKLAPSHSIDRMEEISIKALISLKKQRKKRKLEFYEMILRLAFLKMKDSAKLGKSELLFEVPPYLSTSELYNQTSCVYYLKTRFAKTKEKEKVLD